MAKKQVVKRSSNGACKIYDDGTILINDVRLAYVFLRKARGFKNKNDAPKYSVTGLIPKDSTIHAETIPMIKDFIRDMMVENKCKSLKAAMRFLRDGDADAGDEADSIFAGHWYVKGSESTEKPPLLYDADGESIGRDPDGIIYSGCVGDIMLRPWWQDNEFGIRANSGVQSVRFRRDGEALAGDSRVNPEEVEEAWSDDDYDDGSATSKPAKASKAAADTDEDW
jgi:hypothetical protein